MENLLKACSFLSSGPSEIAGPDVAAWNELWRDELSEPERKPLSIFWLR